MKNKYTITVEGETIDIEFNRRVRRVLTEMELDKYTVYGTILALGEKLINLLDGEELIIIDEFIRKGIVIKYDGITSAIDVISVVHMENIYVKKGVKVLKYGIK